MCLLLAVAPEFGGGGHLSDVAVIKQTPVVRAQREKEKSVYETSRLAEIGPRL
jgi:hypothetical protein